jgi:hypothetical protein
MDQDELSDDQEMERGTDLQNPDSDGDGFIDGFEIESGTDPLNPISVPFALSPTIGFSRTGKLVTPTDRDGDGLPGDFEELVGSDPEKIDSNNNGIPDGLELLQNNQIRYDAATDSDRDGLPDYMEILVGLDPYSPSTMRDGVVDGFRGSPLSYKYKPFVFDFN